jgi:hypothetical protein
VGADLAQCSGARRAATSQGCIAGKPVLGCAVAACALIQIYAKNCDHSWL